MMKKRALHDVVDSSSNVVDFVAEGGIADDPSTDAEWHNARLLNATLQTLKPGQTLHIRGVFHTMGGIVAQDLRNVTVRLDGRLLFSRDVRDWPRGRPDGHGRTVLECLRFVDPVNLTLTSGLSGTAGTPPGGTLDGRGAAWWGLPFLGFLVRAEDRPRLLHVHRGKDIVLENWLLLNPAYWSTWFYAVEGLRIRHVGISARRTSREGHSLLDLSAFNTDGLDVSGRNVHVHDCNIWCQDDAIAVKDGILGEDGKTHMSENMLFERINATGLGLTIGSIGNYSYVRNITFRDSYLHKTFKGVYLKFRQSNKTRIEDVHVENVIMDEPQQWPIWIGPAQQADARNPCHANPCSLCWPLLPGMTCGGEVNGTYSRLSFRNVTINRPRQGGGVILADWRNPIRGIFFDGVRVNDCGELHYSGNVGEAFPLLPQDAPRDNGVTIFLWGFVLIFVCVVWATVRVVKWFVSLRCWRHGLLTERVGSLVLWSFILFAPAASWLVHLNLSTAEPGYFMCEGVVDGIASGGTWPIPPCFEDRTGVPSDVGICPRRFWLKPDFGVSLTFLLVGIIGGSVVAMTYCYERRIPHMIAIPDIDSDEVGGQVHSGESGIKGTTDARTLLKSPLSLARGRFNTGSTQGTDFGDCPEDSHMHSGSNGKPDNFQAVLT